MISAVSLRPHVQQHQLLRNTHQRHCCPRPTLPEGGFRASTHIQKQALKPTVTTPLHTNSSSSSHPSLPPQWAFDPHSPAVLHHCSSEQLLQDHAAQVCDTTVCSGAYLRNMDLQLAGRLLGMQVTACR
jgi:hypothetical protein